jgi:hypothetical protein
VDHLADQGFPVQDVTVVGVDPMLVERVVGRLNRARVLLACALSGAWLGLLVGLLLDLFAATGPSGPVLVGVLSGIVFGAVSAAAAHGMPRGRRDSSSASQLVAGRYDVLCQPRHAEMARDLLARPALPDPPDPRRRPNAPAAGRSWPTRISWSAAWRHPR